MYQYLSGVTNSKGDQVFKIFLAMSSVNSEFETYVYSFVYT